MWDDNDDDDCVCVLCRCDTTTRGSRSPQGHATTQAYLILDEFIIGGELQETAIQVILDRLAELDKLDT